MLIERPYDDETVVLSYDEDASDDEFQRRAGAWWSGPSQLALLQTESTEQRRAAEVEAFRDAVKAWATAGVKIPPVVNIDFRHGGLLDQLARAEDPAPRALRRPPKALRGDHYPTIPAVTRRGVNSYVMARDEERQDTPTGVLVRYVEGGIVANVEMRDGLPTPDHAAIRRVASELGGIDEDVLDVAIAHAVTEAPDNDRIWWLDVDAVVAARGRGMKHKTEAKTYTAGARDEARQDVVDAFDALDHLWLAVGEPERRGRRVQQTYDRVFHVVKRIANPANPDELYSVGYRFGAWFQTWRSGVALAPRQLLELDGRNGAPAKRLGRYFTLLADEADARGCVRKTVRQTLLATRRSAEPGKNPQRVRSWVESNLTLLVDQHVIAAWSYDPPVELKGYGWFEPWLDACLCVTLSRPQLPVG